MNEYHKIQTVFKRDESTRHKTLLEEQYSLPVFDYLKDNQWVFTEKVDGTNIRVMLKDYTTHLALAYGGKSEAAQIPATLLQKLHEIFDSQEPKMKELFPEGVCLYGEGYGPKIQKGGGNYGAAQDFVLFDIRIGFWWLERSAVEDIASKLGLKVVPTIGSGTLSEMVQMARRGIRSTWGDFQAEGVVARPEVELFTGNRRRVITKIKTKDFFTAGV